MIETKEIKDAIDAQGKAWEEFKVENDAKWAAAEKAIAVLNRPDVNLGGSNVIAAPLPAFVNVKTKQRIPVLQHKDSLAALGERTGTPLPSLGRLLRGMVLGSRADDARELEEERKSLGISADPGGGYLVPTALSGMFVDLLRAKMVLSQAGALTVPMDTADLTVAKLTADPAVSWHGENAAISSSDPTFGAATLHAKTVTALSLMSLELSQDAANIEQVLQNSLARAMAVEIDRAGLQGPTSTTGTAAAPLGIMNAPGRNSVTSIGAPTDWSWLVDAMYKLAATNVPIDQIGAFIAHPAVWKKMTKLPTGLSGDKTPLRAPDDVARLPKLWTTSAPLTGGTTANGIVGYWPDLLFGVRQAINVRVLGERFLADNLQVAVLAYARVDFATVRESSFCTCEGITV
jgi:HK97 family phage major capsid protein